MPAHQPSAIDHVKDTTEWEFFDSLFGEPKAWHLPEIFGFQITKFMILELVAAALILIIFIPICRRAGRGNLPKGAWSNAFESLLTFIRSEVAQPAIGHDADKYVPYLWTVFVFILFCNLLGMFPFLGSPTASLAVTAGLALFSLVMFHGAAIVKEGPIRYVKSLWPHIDVPYVGVLFSTMIFTIEFMGTFIKSAVLAVRLFANMFAGHMVLASILIFINMAAGATFTLMWSVVTVSSVLGMVALSLLELFVAFLQAYVFTFLTALFMGMSLHPEH
jgi:F-type H+-transporting ATPase subunit a